MLAQLGGMRGLQGQVVRVQVVSTTARIALRLRMFRLSHGPGNVRLGGLLIVHTGYASIFLAGAACYLLAIATLWGGFGGRREKRFEQR